MIVAGRVSQKMAPVLRRLYEDARTQMGHLHGRLRHLGRRLQQLRAGQGSTRWSRWTSMFPDVRRAPSSSSTRSIFSRKKSSASRVACSRPSMWDENPGQTQTFAKLFRPYTGAGRGLVRHSWCFRCSKLRFFVEVPAMQTRLFFISAALISLLCSACPAQTDVAASLYGASAAAGPAKFPHPARVRYYLSRAGVVGQKRLQATIFIVIQVTANTPGKNRCLNKDYRFTISHWRIQSIG